MMHETFLPRISMSTVYGLEDQAVIQPVQVSFKKFGPQYQRDDVPASPLMESR